MSDQIKRHTEREAPQPQLPAIVRGSLETRRTRRVQKLSEPGRPPPLTRPKPHRVIGIEYDRIEHHATQQQPDRVAHDWVFGCEPRRGWAASDEVRRCGPVQGYFGRKANEVLRYELKEDEGGENHEEPLAQRGSDFSVVELAYAEKVFLCEVEADFLPGLAHRYQAVRRSLAQGGSVRGCKPVYKLPHHLLPSSHQEMRRAAPTTGACVCDPRVASHGGMDFRSVHDHDARRGVQAGLQVH